LALGGLQSLDGLVIRKLDRGPYDNNRKGTVKEDEPGLRVELAKQGKEALHIDRR
jgi:hypothetical protein